MSRGAGRRRPPLPLLLAAGAVVALLQLPLAYLLVRTIDGRGRALDVLWDDATLRLVWNTALLVAGVVTAALLVGLPLAWLVVRTDLPARRLWATAAALPLVVPSYVAALCLLGAFGRRGVLDDVPLLGRAPEVTGYWGALLALTLATYPYVFLLVQASLRGLDPSLEEAARALGRSRSAAFRSVTLPALRPALGAASLLVALYTLSDFGVVSLMRYDALTRAVYLQYRSLFDRTPAAVLALVLVALTACVLVLEHRTRTRGRLYRSAPGAVRRQPPVRLGRWRWPALAYCAAVVGTFLVLPAVVLGTWLVRGLRDDRGLSFPLGQAVNSLAASGLAAGAAVLAALPVAVLVVRHPSRAATVLGRLAYGANALPGIVIALSLVFFAARYASPVYQTLALLVFAYCVRFFPQALAGVESALGAVSPRLEEVSHGLGRGPVATLGRVTLPLARSGLAAGAALVFLSTMKELPATLLLRPIGFETLATEIWKLTQIGAYSRAAVPALALIAVSAPFLWLVSRDRRPGERRTGVE